MANYRGNLEGLTGATVRGWATDLDARSQSCHIHIEVDQIVIATVLGDSMRVDVAGIFPGSLFSGFEFTLPERYRDGKLHLLRAFLTNDVQIGLPTCFEIHSVNTDELELLDATNTVSDRSNLGTKGAPYFNITFESANFQTIVTPSPWATLGQNDDSVGGATSHRQFRPHPSYCFTAAHQIVNADHGIFYSKSGKAFAFSTYLRNQEQIRKDHLEIAEKPENLKKLRGRWLVFSTSGKSNYFHWHLDCLVGLFVAKNRFGTDWKPLCKNLDERQLDAVSLIYGEKEGLREQSFDNDSGDLYEIESVCGTAYLDGRGIFPDHNVGAMFFYLKGRLDDQSSNSQVHRKLFISRQDGKHRSILNEDEIWALLSERGYVRLVLSNLSYQEQATLFLNAEVVVASHGAGLTNIGYCRSGATIIELIPRDYTNFCFRFLAIQCNLRHFWYCTGTLEDFSVDLDDFRSHLLQWEPQ